MRASILKQGSVLIASVQGSMTDADLAQMRDELVGDVRRHRSTGVIHTVLGGVGGKEDFDTAIFEEMEELVKNVTVYESKPLLNSAVSLETGTPLSQLAATPKNPDAVFQLVVTARQRAASKPSRVRTEMAA